MIDEHLEHAEAGEQLMESDSGSADGSDEDAEPGGGPRGDCEHDEEAGHDVGVDEKLGEEEVSPPQVATQPRLPSRDECDVHEAMGHTQFRNWCEACIHGQGREDLHLRGEKWRSLPVVSYDYAFLSEHDMNSAKDKKREVNEAKEATKLLIGK